MKSLLRVLFSRRTIVLVLLVAALVGGGAYLYFVQFAGAGAATFRTDPVQRKNLAATISATGTLEPQQVIDVGAQVAGLITAFGPADPDPKDPTKSATPNGPVVDYCSVVQPGQILALIDPTIYDAQVKQATAAVAVANASQASATANLAKSVANRDAMLDTYKRDVASPGAVNEQQIFADKAAYESSVADCKLQEANIKQAEASIQQAQANLTLAQTNLGYCTIKAPPDTTYTIVDRRVAIGQTVVASLSAPSLFLLAKDLTKMQIWASVNEADVGNIHVGQEVTFTVDARPGKTYNGVVSQIRLNASMTQNVVTYTVLVDTTNQMIDVPPQTHAKKSGKAAKPTPPSSDPAPAADNAKPHSEDTLNTTPTQELELLPYETTNLTFHVANRENALLVPNAALRWRPQLQQVDPKYRDEYENSLRKKAAKDSGSDDSTAPPSAPTAAPKAGTDSTDKSAAKPHEHTGGAASRGMVWVQVPNSNLVRPIRLVTGLTDGANTEVVRVITDDNLHKDDALDDGGANERQPTMLITGENTTKSASATTNPFAPKLPFGPQQPKKTDDQK